MKVISSLTIQARQVLGIDLDIAEVDGAGLFQAHLGAPQDCLDAQYELLDRKRLGDVIISTQFKTLDDLVIRGFGGQHDDGLVAVLGADAITDFIAVHTWQHDVEEDQVKLARQCLFEALRAGCGTVDLVFMEHEHIDKALTDGLFVFDNENADLPAHSID